MEGGKAWRGSGRGGVVVAGVVGVVRIGLVGVRGGGRGGPASGQPLGLWPGSLPSPPGSQAPPGYTQTPSQIQGWSS